MFIIKLLAQRVSGRHHYAHHQENKTEYYCIWCSALVVLAVVVWSCVVSCVHCVHCVKVTIRTVNFTQCTRLHTTTASTTSAEHHMQ